MEEDAGKLIHDLTVADSLFDANRCGTPLLEIVSEPDLRSPEEAIAYLEKLKQILEYLDICDANMERGNMRCDANISIRKGEDAPFGERVELKNMNSFSNLLKAMHSEIELQAEILDAGGIVKRETKRWDPAKATTVTNRSKEDAQDYRYFPEPDLVRLSITPADIERVRSTLPELPEARRKRYAEQYGLPVYDADVLTREKAVSEFYERACAVAQDKKAVSNWVMGDVLRVLKEGNLAISDLRFTPEHIGEMAELIRTGTISGKIAKEVFEHLFAPCRHRVHQDPPVVPFDLAIHGHPDLLGDPARREVRRIDERDEPIRGEGSRGPVARRRRRLGRVTATPQVTTDVPAELDLCPALDHLDRRPAVADDGPARAVLHREQAEAVALVPFASSFDPGFDHGPAERRRVKPHRLGVAEDGEQWLDIVGPHRPEAQPGSLERRQATRHRSRPGGSGASRGSTRPGTRRACPWRSGR
jgi:hypothetical protein